jgi:hypothetical protein
MVMHPVTALGPPGSTDPQSMGYLTISGQIYKVSYIANHEDCIDEAKKIDYLAQAEMLLKSLLKEAPKLKTVEIFQDASIQVDGADFDANKTIDAQFIQQASSKGSYEIKEGTTLKVAAFFINQIFGIDPKGAITRFIIEEFRGDSTLEIRQATGDVPQRIRMPLPYTKKGEEEEDEEMPPLEAVPEEELAGETSPPPPPPGAAAPRRPLIEELPDPLDTID